MHVREYKYTIHTESISPAFTILSRMSAANATSAVLISLAGVLLVRDFVWFATSLAFSLFTSVYVDKRHRKLNGFTIFVHFLGLSRVFC